ncbi:MAG: hypothetical protein H6725_12535 [Sandaracinaceae bacterium]|nr:hypothetical protein [Sandaracinaceae bacterium]
MPAKPREPKPPIDSPLATTAEACDFLRISRKTFMRHVACEIDYVEVGARQIWIWESVYDWVDRNAVHKQPRLPVQPATPPWEPPKRTPEQERAHLERVARFTAPRLQPADIRKALAAAGAPMTTKELGVALGLGSGKVSTVASQMHRDGEVTREKVRAVWVYQLAVPPASGRRNG